MFLKHMLKETASQRLIVIRRPNKQELPTNTLLRLEQPVYGFQNISKLISNVLQPSSRKIGAGSRNS